MSDPGELEEQATLDDYQRRLDYLSRQRKTSLDAKWLRWVASPAGQDAYKAILLRARMLLRSGHRHYGIKALWEAVRFDYSVRLGPDHGFKMNNNYSSRMARYIMESHPELKGFFETRELRS